jgi:hypothetical protein
VKTLAIKLPKTFSASTAYPKYRPCARRTMDIGTKRNPCVVDVVVYHDSKEFRYDYKRCPDGASAVFIPNNAATNNSKQFALKIFYNKKEAYSTWRRQELAAEKGLAPPVGKMVVVLGKNGKIKHLGYQTAVCDMGKNNYIPQKLVDKLSDKLFSVILPTDCLDGDDFNDFFLDPEYKIRLGDDLHIDNYGIWKGNLVCIDFGIDSLSYP